MCLEAFTSAYLLQKLSEQIIRFNGINLQVKERRLFVFILPELEY